MSALYDTLPWSRRFDTHRSIGGALWPTMPASDPFVHHPMTDLAFLSFCALVACVFVLGGFVKGVVGLGLPTIAMGLLSVLMLPAQAAGLLVVPSLVTNLWQIGGAGLIALLRRTTPMLLGVCAGVWTGAGWLTAPPAASQGASTASLGLGLALLVYAAFGLLHWRPRVRPANEVWLGPMVGFATGLMGVGVTTARRFAYACLDWSERRDHLAGSLAVALLDHALQHGWMRRTPGSRALTLTPTGAKALAPWLITKDQLLTQAP